MPFIRISVMTPQPGQEQKVSELIDELLKLYKGRPGFIQAFRLVGRGAPEGNRYGRLSIWETQEDARSTASVDHDMYLQSQLKLISDDTTHEEYAFEGFPLP